MKAAVLTAPRALQIDDRAAPSVGPDDVLLRVHTCGVCGTDSHIFQGEFLVKFPVVPGHEVSGSVEEVGENVTHVRPGDPVTVDPNIHCGVCRFCRAGKINLCENLTAVGVNRDGGFAGYCRAPAKQVLKLPENVSLEAGAFAEPLACCLHGLDRARFEPGMSVLILGGGSIGQQMLQLVKTGGARQVVLSEPMENRRQLALACGADHVIDPLHENAIKAMREATGGGADLTIECVGRPQTVEQAVKSTLRGGTVLLFGVSGPEDLAKIHPYEVFLHELTIVGSFINPFTQSRAIEALAAGRFDPSKIISHRYPVAGFGEALEQSRSRDAVKVVVQPAKEEAGRD
ncbi:MAG: zinc-dependent alcohol dehydrogenase family protein [Armatimonadetes bacterium]|nr:zinc-dependent alcohol dehydrogenase family protein [Armatimonadota bacterium]